MSDDVDRRLADLLMPRDAGSSFEEQAAAVRDLAHRPERLHDCTKLPGGESEPVAADQQFRLKVEGWETSLIFCYAIDAVRENRGVAAALRTDDMVDVTSIAVRHVRHLTIQFSVPAHLTQGILNMRKDQFLAFMAPLAKPFFPLHDRLAATLLAHPAVPIRDIRARPEDRVVTYRTPVSAHFLVDVEDAASVTGRSS